MKKVNEIKSVSRSIIAAAFGVTNPAVNAWLKKGCPRNDDGTYDLAKVISWRLEDLALTSDAASDPEAAKWLAAFRKERFRRARFERQRLEKKFVAVADVERVGYEAGRQIKNHCQGIPERCAALVAAENDIFKCKQILAKEINIVLHNLSERLKGFK